MTKIDEGWKFVQIGELKHEDPLPTSNLIELLKKQQGEMDVEF